MNVVYFATKNEAEAQKIAKAVISEKLAFCANIIPSAYSIYLWKGKVEESDEAIVILKTLPHLVKKLISTVKRLHSYEMPEIISWKIDQTTPEVEKWASAELK